MAGESLHHPRSERLCLEAATEPRPDGRGESMRLTKSSPVSTPQRSPGLMAGERSRGA